MTFWEEAMQESSSWGERICDDGQLMIDNLVMEQLSDISARRNHVAALIKCAENRRATVTPQIYQRVYEDYIGRLTTINEELKPVSKQVETRLQDIKRLETMIGKCLRSIGDDLEEQEFRCSVGEFDKRQLTRHTEHLTKLRDSLNHQAEIAQSTLATCSQHLDSYSADENIADNKLLKSAPLPESSSSDTPTLVQTLTTLAPSNPMPSEPESAGPAHVAPTTATFLKVSGINTAPKTYELNKCELTIGKSSRNDIVIRRAGISRKHAQLTFKGDGNYTIQDLSGNGLSLNGTQTESATIVHGDIVSLANVDLELVVN